MVSIYKPKTMADIQNMLKDMFAGTMEDMLKAELGRAWQSLVELGSELGYSKHDRRKKGLFWLLDW